MKPQNLLFLFSDQHTRGALGCYGHPMVKTPNLDRLAARGALFRNAYCNSPICVPSRAALATSRYVFETGYWDNAKPYEGAVPSWGHRLTNSGHRVESIGKLHFRSDSDPNGFARERLPMHVVGGIGDILGSVRDEGVVMAKFRGYLEEAGPGESTYTHYDRDITQEAVRWLDEEAPKYADTPWVLFVSLVCPHPPLLAPEAFYAMYLPERIPLPPTYDPSMRASHPAIQDLRRFMGIEEPFSDDVVRRLVAAYFGLCSFLDDNIGKVLNALDESGLSQSTRVLYASDHGEANGVRGIWGKCNMYEESVSVPMILVGDGVPAGASVDTPVSLVDCYPTIVECVGAPSLTEDCCLRGHSLFDVANGAQSDRFVFAEYHAHGSTAASYLVRKGSMKYVHYVDHPDQLFDLAKDPQEIRDLIDDPDYSAARQSLEGDLRSLLDPEEVDRRAKSDQMARLAAHGGRAAILARGSFGYTPAPGETAVFK